jgi:hypothetical protein
MFGMFWATVKAFMKGKLFQNQTKATLLGLVGVGLTALLFALLSRFMQLELAGAIAGLCGGVVQPFLFKNLKFR